MKVTLLTTPSDEVPVESDDDGSNDVTAANNEAVISMTLWSSTS